jgi:hypothetical protein
MRIEFLEAAESDMAEAVAQYNEPLAKPPCGSDKPRPPRPERAYGGRVLLVKTGGFASTSNIMEMPGFFNRPE